MHFILLGMNLFSNYYYWDFCSRQKHHFSFLPYAIAKLCNPQQTCASSGPFFLGLSLSHDPPLQSWESLPFLTKQGNGMKRK